MLHLEIIIITIILEEVTLEEIIEILSQIVKILNLDLIFLIMKTLREKPQEGTITTLQN